MGLATQFAADDRIRSDVGPAVVVGRSTSRALAVLLTVLCLWSAASGENWPQWRGPSSQGVSSEIGLPLHWGPGSNIAWKASLAGTGTSSPIVWESLVVVTSQVGRVDSTRRSYPRLARDEPELAEGEAPIADRRLRETEDESVLLVVEAFDKSTGTLLWHYRIPALGELPDLHEKHNLATPTPLTDGELIYAWFGNGQILSLDMNGNLLWTRHLGRDYGSFLNRWGHGSSPALYEDLLILLSDHAPRSYLLALDKKSGEERWKVDRGKGRISHSTPLVVTYPGNDELIVNSSERIDSFDPATGDSLWYAGTPRQTPIPSPVFRDGLIYLSRGYRNSDFLAIRPGGRGDVSKSHVLWRSPRGASYVPSILLYEGLLFMTNEVGVVTCAEASSGARVWRKRLGGIFFASPVAGDGKVYMVSETGETIVIEASRQARVLARNDLEERFVASPAISGGRLFLRSDGTLFSVRR